MFGALPQILSYRFFVAFVLPATVLIAGSLLVSDLFGQVSIAAMGDWVLANEYLATVSLPLLVWLVGGLLLALNTTIMRIKEGYGWLRLVFSPLTWLHRLHYRKLQEESVWLDRQAALHGGLEDSPAAIQQAKIAAEGRLANYYPDRERWILPFAFGNTVRAFEIYPRVMYGLDGIAGWSRILGVMPDEFRHLVEDARTRVDLILNMWSVSLVLLVQYVALELVQESWPMR